jgi:hypothetical protein
MFRSYVHQAEPRRGPIQATRSGTVAPRCIAGSMSPTIGFLQHLEWRSSLACLSSAVWLPGTLGKASSTVRALFVSPGATGSLCTFIGRG